VCLAWPFTKWWKSTLSNYLFRGVVEDDPKGLTSLWDGKSIIVRLWVKEAADKSQAETLCEPRCSIIQLMTYSIDREIRCNIPIKIGK
jgi:hypothetical protein